MKVFSRLRGLFLTPGNRPRRWLCWVVGLYAAYCLFAGLILPYALKGVVEKQLSAALRSNCTLERLAFNPFTFTAGAYGLVIPYPEGDGNFLTLESVELAPGFSTLLRLAPALGHLTVVNPAVTLTLYPDGRVSPAQFAPQGEQPAPAPEKEDTGGFFPFIISNLTLRGGKVDFFDRMHNATHTVRDLNFHVPFTSSLESDRQRAVRPTLNATIDDRFVSLNGRTTPFAESQRTEFRLNIGELPLDRLRPYVESYTSLSPERGQLTAETVLHVRKDQDGMLKAGLSGSLYINDLALASGTDGTVFSLDYAALEMDRLLLDSQRLSIKEMLIQNPMVRLGREKDGSLNWERYLRAPKKAAVASSAATPTEKNTPAGKNATAATTRNATAGAANATAATMNATAQAAKAATDTAHNATANNTNATAQAVNATGNTRNATSGAMNAAAGEAAATVPPIPVISVAKLSIAGGIVHWKDAATAGGVTQVFTPIGLEVRDFSTEGPGRGHFAFTLGQESVAAESATEAFFAAAGITAVEEPIDQTPDEDAPAPASNSTAASTGNGTLAANSGASVNGTVSVNGTAVSTANATAAAQPEQNLPAAPATPEARAAARPAPSPSGNFALRGNLTLKPLALKLQVASDRLSLMHAAPYLQGAGVTLKNASLDADAAFSVRVDDKNPLLLSQTNGTVALRGLSAALPLDGGSAALTLDAFGVRGVSVDMSKNSAQIETLAVSSPHAQLALARAASTKAAAAEGKATSRASGKKAPASKKPKADKGSAKAAPDKNSASAAAPAPAGGNPFVLGVKTIRLTDGQVDVTAGGDTAPSLQLSTLDFTVSNFSTLAGQELSFNGSGLWNKTGKLALAGKGVLSPLRLEVSPKLSAVPLQSVEPWLRGFSALRMNSGALSCDLAVRVAETGTPKAGGQTPSPAVNVTGEISLSDLSLLEGKQETVGFRRFQASGLRLDTAASTYDIGAVTLAGPRLAFTLYADGMDSVSRAMDVTGEARRKAQRAARKKAGPSALEKAVQEQEKAQEASGSAAQTAASSAKPAAGKSGSGARALAVPGVKRLTLGRFTMQEGIARVRDERLPQKATINLSGLNMKAEGISSAPGTAASFNLTGKVEGAPLSLEAKANPLYMPVEGQMKFSLDALDVTALSPYSLKYIAYPIDKGALSLNINVNTAKGMLESNNVIILNKLTLGDKVDAPGAPNLPVKLGLSLLEDTQGVVNLTLPITGRLDDPELRTGGLVLKAVAGVLFKIVASPFSLLGSVLGGGDGPSLQYVAFAPGDDRLNAEAVTVIQAVVDLLKKKPEITLVLQGMADEGERKEMGRAFVRKGVQALKWDDLSEKEQAATLPADVSLDTASEEYADLLFDVYAEQKFDKPKTLGVTRKQPVDVMEKMIADHVPVTDAAVENLARKRAQAVLDRVSQLAPELKGRVSVAPDQKIREAAGGQTTYSRVELGIK